MGLQSCKGTAGQRVLPEALCPGLGSAVRAALGLSFAETLLQHPAHSPWQRLAVTVSLLLSVPHSDGRSGVPRGAAADERHAGAADEEDGHPGQAGERH